MVTRRMDNESFRANEARNERFLFKKEVLEEYQAEIQEAQQKAEVVFAMPMPQDYQEFVKMLMECDRNIKRPLMQSALATKLSMFEKDFDEYIDYETPSKVIQEAWSFRLENLLEYGQTMFGNYPNFPALIEMYSKKTLKSKQKENDKFILRIFEIYGIVLVILILSLFLFD